MFINTIQNAINRYGKSATALSITELMRIVSLAATLLSVVAFLFILMFVLAAANMAATYGLYVLGGGAVLGLLAFGYLCSGYKGAMISEFNLSESGPVSLSRFLKHAFSKAPQYFLVSITQGLVIVLVSLPVLAAFVFMKLNPSDTAGLALIILLLAAISFVRYLFSYLFISIALKGGSTIGCMKEGLMVILKNPVDVIAIYVLYGITGLLLLVPFLDIVAFLAMHPITYLAMINISKNRR